MSQKSRRYSVQRCTVTLYHETLASALPSILREGFIDNGTRYETDDGLRDGIWFSEKPPTYRGTHPNAWSVLKVELNLAESQLESFLWRSNNGHRRRWLIPAGTVNAHILRCIPMQ